MERIIFASIHKNDNKLAWSGTNYYIYKSLEHKYNVNYVWVHSYLASLLRFVLKRLKLYYLSELLFCFFISKKFEILMKKYCEEYVVCVDAKQFIVFSKTNKKIVYITDSTYHLMIGYYIFNISNRLIKLYNCIEKITLENSYKIILSSNWAKNDCMSYYNVDSNKIELIRFGANIDDKYYDNTINHIIGNEINLLIVGVEFYRKGIDIAIKTIKKLNEIDRNHTYKLHIVGIEKEKILNYMNNGEYNDNLDCCIYYGRLYKNNEKDLIKLIDLYKKCNLFILPTRAECAGIVFSESSMFSLPVIANDTGGVNDYVKDNINGFLIYNNCNVNEYVNKILEIINDNNLYTKLCHNAKEYYENELNWKYWADRFSKIIDNK